MAWLETLQDLAGAPTAKPLADTHLTGMLRFEASLAAISLMRANDKAQAILSHDLVGHLLPGCF